MESTHVPQITVQTNASRLLIFGVAVSTEDKTDPDVLQKIAGQLIGISKKAFDSSGMIQMRLEITKRGNVLIHELSSDLSHKKAFSRNAVMFKHIPLILEKPVFVSAIISVDGARFPYMPIEGIDVIAFRDPQTRDVRILSKNQSHNFTFDSSISSASCSKAQALKLFEDAPALQRQWQERNTNFSFELPSSSSKISTPHSGMGDIRAYKLRMKQQIAPMVGEIREPFTLRMCIQRDGTPTEVIAWSSSDHSIHQEMCGKLRLLHFDPLPDWYRGDSLILQFGFP
jgi:hypothetical protein